ncbi:MAG: proprotein convertase P-domain-containing protein, partial [Ferruginibacter sp.]
MRKLLLTLLSCCGFILLHAQTFTNSTGGAIPDGGPQVCFPLTVSGVGPINGTFGLASVCINIDHTWDSDLEIYLKAPDGTLVALSLGNGGSGNNYTGTCFTATAATAITAGAAPFTGTYKPEGNLGAVNNGQNANGVWSLCVEDVTFSDNGTVLNWSATFNNTPAPPPPPLPSCSGNAPAGNTCAAAAPVCNFNGFCGNTSSSYTADYWTQLNNTFCGTIENNSFISFVASATSATFSVWVTSSQNGDGIQMMFYSGACGSGPVTSYGCYNQMLSADPSLPITVTATGLTIGNTYYLMIDGYAGDVCEYVIAAGTGVNVLGVTTSLPGGNSSICLGSSVVLTATGGNGVYAWSPSTGLSATSGASVTANPTVTTVYTVTSTDISTNCAGVVTKTITVTVNPRPNLGPDKSVSICPATTTNLTTQFTTTGLTTAWTLAGAPVANPAAVGVAGVYQLIGTNASGCKDTALVTVTVDPKPNLGPDKTGNICSGNALDLTTLFTTTGYTTAWTLGGTSVANPAAVTATGTYQVIVSNGPGCADTALVVVSANPKPNLGADITLNLCSNETVDLTTQFTTTGLTTVWTVGGVPVTTPTSVNTSGIYQLIATNASGCKDTANVNLTVTPKPVLGPDKSVPVCSGVPVDLTTQFTTTGLTTTWTIGGTPVATPTSVTTPGIYQLIAVGANSCADTALVTITLSPKPNLGIDKTVSICPNGS